MHTKKYILYTLQSQDPLQNPRYYPCIYILLLSDQLLFLLKHFLFRKWQYLNVYRESTQKQLLMCIERQRELRKSSIL